MYILQSLILLAWRFFFRTFRFSTLSFDGRVSFAPSPSTLHL